MCVCEWVNERPIVKCYYKFSPGSRMEVAIRDEECAQGVSVEEEHLFYFHISSVS